MKHIAVWHSIVNAKNVAIASHNTTWLRYSGQYGC